MIPLRRLPEPAVLREHKDEWKARYLERRAQSPKLRPSHKQYGHDEIRAALAAMSHGKCFYCEGKPSRLTVDHGIEVEEAPELSFVWENLYLACDDCQNKLANRVIAMSECADPCAAFDPDEHFAFEDDMIRPVSACGDSTVRKYRLNAEIYNGRRARALNHFLRVLVAILERKSADRREEMLPEEIETLRRFARPDWPYSLMFRFHLRRNGHDAAARG